MVGRCIKGIYVKYSHQAVSIVTFEFNQGVGYSGVGVRYQLGDCHPSRQKLNNALDGQMVDCCVHKAVSEGACCHNTCTWYM